MHTVSILGSKHLTNHADMKKEPNTVKFLSTEKKAIKWLSLIVAFRMLGLFMLLPVLALYAGQFRGATPGLIGLAIGIYGLTQALLQIPFGMLSDKLGRKKVIVAGLLLFATGSVVAALADSIYLLIFGRALQGSGAVAAVAMALIADLTREEVRVRSMAIFGISIGASFMVAIVAGPVISSYTGVSGIFWITALLALLAIIILLFKVPTPVKSTFHADTSARRKQFLKILADGQLLRLNFGIFVLHLVLTAIFITVPGLLRDVAGIAIGTHGLVYFGVMLVSIALMIPFVIMAETKDKMKQIFVGAVFILVLAQVLFLQLSSSVYGILLALIVFFAAFNVLEATLPSLVAKTAPADKKGTAMGVYSSSQFLGAFTGGALGGWFIESTNNVSSVFWMALFVLLLWLVFAASMRKPDIFGTTILNVGKISPEQAKVMATDILAVPGVEDVIMVADDGMAYVKIANDKIDRKRLLQYSINEFKGE